MTTHTTNIRDYDKFMNTQWDWTPYNSAFNAGVRISDIDGHIERHSEFLYIETKLPGNSPTFAQELSIRSQIAKGNTVMLLEGNPNRPERLTLYRRDGTVKVYNEVTEELVTDILKQWWNWASKKPRLSDNVSANRKRVIKDLYNTLSTKDKEALLQELK